MWPPSIYKSDELVKMLKDFEAAQQRVKRELDGGHVTRRSLRTACIEHLGRCGECPYSGQGVDCEVPVAHGDTVKYVRPVMYPPDILDQRVYPVSDRRYKPPRRRKR